MKHQTFSTLVEIIDFIDSKYQNDNAFNYIKDNQWTHISTQEFANDVRFLSLALNKIGIKRGVGFGMVSYQNPIWLMMDFSIIASGAICVPIFPEISNENLFYQIDNADIEYFFCDTLDSFEALNSSDTQFKKIIINFDLEGKESFDNVIYLDELMEIGKEIYQEKPESYKELIRNINQNDLATIIYTSGSTGMPKGVRITHKNLVSQIQGTAKLFPLDSKIDVALSFLPLAHIFERMVVSFYVAKGVSIYFVDDIQKISERLNQVNPTLMTVVPRVLEKIFNKIKNGVSEANIIKKFIGRVAIYCAIKFNPDSNRLIQKLILKLLDKLVYNKIRSIFGNKIRMIICGGAALMPELECFYRNIGINLYIGYGMTESSPVIAVNHSKYCRSGTVGKVFPGVLVKLNKNGELLAKGKNIMEGYHKDPDKTSQTIDYNGWLSTGDLAKIDSDGFIKIIGRKKELFKTSGGKYVSPIPIEQKLLSNWQPLAAVAIIAEGRKFVSCLLFIDFEILEKYKEQKNLSHLTNEEFLKSDFMVRRIDKLITKVNHGLNSWERIRKYYLSTNPISIKTGELTSSMKLKRNFVEEKFKNEIQNIYSN